MTALRLGVKRNPRFSNTLRHRGLWRMLPREFKPACAASKSSAFPAQAPHELARLADEAIWDADRAGCKDAATLRNRELLKAAVILAINDAEHDLETQAGRCNANLGHFDLFFDSVTILIVVFSFLGAQS